MDGVTVLHMKRGKGDTSYASNSSIQKKVISMTKPIREEVISGCCMVLTFLDRRSEAPFGKDGCHIWNLLATALNEMVTDGIIHEDEVNAFNMLLYTLSSSEVKLEIIKKGSFAIHRLKCFKHKLEWVLRRGRSNELIKRIFRKWFLHREAMRVVAKPLLVSHFGEAIIDDVFCRYGKIVAECMKKEKRELINITVSLTKKEMA